MCFQDLLIIVKKLTIDRYFKWHIRKQVQKMLQVVVVLLLFNVEIYLRHG